VRSLAILAAGLTATVGLSANSVVVVSVQRCSSQSNVIFEVTRKGKGISHARVDIYQEIEHGERPAWAGTTAARGIARPSQLVPGEYRVVADFRKADATMFLHVTSSENIGRCEIKLDPPDPSKTLDSVTEPTVSITARNFRGVIQDDSGAVLPRANVRVLRRLSDKKDIMSVLADERGRFSLRLTPGTYFAVVQMGYFRTQVLEVKISKDGWDAMKLTMEVYGANRTAPPQKLDWPN
jgi:hypothetical protein